MQLFILANNLLFVKKSYVFLIFTGSTLSLGSFSSLSKSQSSLSSTSKGVDLLSVLTHILGRPVPRDSEHGEFVCGKCVSLLEKVFKFDSVIARVKVLSAEKLHKLTQERDKIRQWLRQNYQQRHLQDVHLWATINREEEGHVEKEGYREMLEENMALSKYEFWSDKWDMCPHFIKTGKRCRKGKGCEGCDALRVSDSVYESVCGIPRHLPSQTYKLLLSRDKSQSMPLHWKGTPSTSCSLASLTGSQLSLQAASCTGSVQSLDSLEAFDPFDPASDQSVNFVLNKLRCLKWKPLSSPSGSRIPVLGKKDERCSGDMTSSAVARQLTFEDLQNGEGDVNDQDGDLLTELNEEFMPLYTKVNHFGLFVTSKIMYSCGLDINKTVVLSIKHKTQQQTWSKAS